MYPPLTDAEAKGLATTPTPALRAACELLYSNIFVATYGSSSPLSSHDIWLMQRTRYYIRQEIIRRREQENERT